MGIFKSGGDLIDYTYLQKRGLIKKAAEPKPSGMNKTKDGFVDLSSMNIPEKIDKTPAQSTKSPFDNLFNNANETNSSSSSNANQSSGFVSLFDSPTFSDTSNNSKSINESSLDEKDINALKIKIEDLEFKLGNLTEKLYLVESKLQNFERKTIG